MALREEYPTLMEKQLNDWKAQTEHFKAAADQIEARALLNVWPRISKNSATGFATDARWAQAVRPVLCSRWLQTS